MSLACDIKKSPQQPLKIVWSVKESKPATNGGQQPVSIGLSHDAALAADRQFPEAGRTFARGVRIFGGLEHRAHHRESPIAVTDPAERAATD